MARDDTPAIPPGAWTQVTNANAAAICIQNQTGSPLYLKATVGAVTPVNMQGAKILGAFETLAADLSFADLFPGVPGANRMYVFTSVGGNVAVSHADVA